MLRRMLRLECFATRCPLLLVLLGQGIKVGFRVSSTAALMRMSSAVFETAR